MPQNAACYIALGSNLGNRAGFLRRAIDLLDNNDRITVTAASEFSQSAPLGGTDQPAYLNAAVEIETSLSPMQLLAVTGHIESALGRQRNEKWAPRTIDLDILLYGSQVIDLPDLTIPHKQMHLRSFVLKPLAELAPDLVHPVLNEKISTLAGRLNGADFVINADRPQLISIAGVIGVGKTTLVNNLAEILSAEMIFEDYGKNPFLPEVYAGRTEFALDCQLYFLTSRLRQLSRDKLESRQIYISDYCFEKELIYAKKYLTAEQLTAYKTDYTKSKDEVWPPVLVIYLYDSAEICLERIHSRNRPYEQAIELSLLKELAADYDKLFDNWQKSPVIRLSTSNFDARKKEHVELLADQVKRYVADSGI